MTFLKHFPSRLGTPRDQQVRGLVAVKGNKIDFGVAPWCKN